ncbi:hypothetical protein G9A89_005631 [Geosiphon pyriformis]|nr:hypothetical protein G9A89_005631 [Geosiphon pyriformis]
MKQNIIQATLFELVYSKTTSFSSLFKIPNKESKTTIGPVIAVIKKTFKDTSFDGGFKAVVLRKKRKRDVLEESIDNSGVAAEASGACSWGSETGNTTESESIDIEKKCLVEKTSVNYGESGTFMEGDPDQTPKSLHVKTKKVLKKPLDVIDYNIINAVSVHKFFALDINLVVITGKSFQEKLSFVRKLFSGVNGFGGAFTSSKFGGIIWATFTSEKAIMTAGKLANNCNIVINTDLKHPNNNHMNWAIVIKKISVGTSMEAVRAAISEKNAVCMARANIDKQTWDFRDEFKALLYTLFVKTNAYDLWDFIDLVGGKTCVIDHNPVSYTRACCATVCFGSESDLVSAMVATPVIKKIGLRWFRFSLVLCSVCRIPGHTSFNCVLVKVRLVTIYARKSTPISCPLAFSDKTWVLVVGASPVHNPHGAGSLLGFDKVGKPFLSVAKNLDMHLTKIESSLISLVGQINKLAKRLDSLVLAVLQPSPGWKDIVMGVGLSETTSDRTATASIRNSSASSHVAKLENMLKGFAASVLSLSAHFNSLVLAGSDNIVRRHKEINNLITIVTETKLKVFTLGIDAGHLGSGVAIIMNNSLAWHMCKVLEVPGQFLSIKLLFKNKLFVSILGLYAGASLAVHFSQANDINSMIAKAVNEFSFTILGENFNEDGSHKCASFKKCFNLGLVNSLGESVSKTIDYVFVFSSLVNAILNYEVIDVGNYFDTDYRAVFVSVDVGSFLNTHLFLLHKQANKDYWKYNYTSADDAKWIGFRKKTVVNAIMFSDKFSVVYVLHQMMCLSAESVFKKIWFKSYNEVFNKVSSRFHKLELLVSKIVKASHLVAHEKFVSLLDVWSGFDSANASVVKSLFLLGSHFDTIHSILPKIRKSYCSSKLSESSYKSRTIRSVLEHSFCKVVLDHLVVDDELILEPALVKSKINEIMEGWTRKCKMYQSLNYVYNDAFSGVMGLIDYDELIRVKHCDISVLSMFLVLLNFCLFVKSVSSLWKEAWVLMIPKPYKWKGVLMNTHSIVLIEMAHKILFKIFSDRISLACSTHNVLHSNNFSVLRSTTTQSPIFVIAYDLVGWKHLEKCLLRIKMCVMTDFGLTNGYWVHNRLNQGEVFSPLLWCIFYDPLLCEVKHQESMCEYRLISHFVSGIDSSQAVTQHILNVASEFFRLNNILINNDKTVAIPINCWVATLFLTISGLPISIAKKREPHHYLGIFLFSEGFSKSNLAKTQSDVWFFVNLVLKKAISDKQYVYLVSAVLFPIISYRIQFSFVPLCVCNKWDALIHKVLKSKSGLPHDFPNDVFYHPSLYNLKTFEQIQAEDKSASIVTFVNSIGVLSRLFSYKSHDLQVLSWWPHHFLLFLVCVGVSPSNNFLAGVVCIFFGCDLSLNGFLVCTFYHQSGTSMSFVLGELFFFKYVSSLRHYGIAFVEQLHDHNGNVFSWSTFKCWKRLDLHGLVFFWFDLSICFFGDVVLPSVTDSDVHQSHGFSMVCNTLLTVDAACLSVYMDRSLYSLGTVDIKAVAVIFFEDIDMGLDVGVSGLVSFTLTELQAITLALECVLSSYSIDLFFDSQAALNTCMSESLLVHPEFRNYCWIERHHIVNVKSHSGNLDNEHANALAKDTAEVGFRSRVMVDSLHADIDWFKSSLVWHPNSHLAVALHHWLPVAVRKRLYNRSYSSMMCLYCGDVEILDHVFSCPHNSTVHAHLLNSHALAWEAFSGLFHSSSCVSQLLASCVSENVWLVRVKHWAFMEKHGLILHYGFILMPISGLSMRFSADIIRLLGVEDLVSVHIGV